MEWSSVVWPTHSPHSSPPEPPVSRTPGTIGVLRDGAGGTLVPDGYDEQGGQDEGTGEEQPLRPRARRTPNTCPRVVERKHGRNSHPGPQGNERGRHRPLLAVGF
jgi:hypothetical protein